MNRREFFSLPRVGKELFSPQESLVAEYQIQSQFYAPTSTPRPRKGLGKFGGTWTSDTAAHLLRRSVFGPKKDEITLFTNLGLAGSINVLFAAPGVIVPPLYHENETYSGDKQNLPWIYSAGRYNVENRNINLKGWWIKQMVEGGTNLSTKMTLFWHNHLVTGTTTVNDARWSYEYIKLLQDNCFGNFKTLVKAISSNAAMLRYLSGDQNRKGSPNENYARELLELFTLGASKPNGTPNYIEDDVVAAAKVLTGWKTTPGNNGVPSVQPWASFVANNHDTSKKIFSSHFNNAQIQRVLPTEYQLELDDLIDMIFARTEVAHFIVREFYKWFVYYEVDSWVETNIITPLANQFRNGNYEIKPIIQTLLQSEHFFDAAVMGTQIKNPADFVVGMVRQFGISLNPVNRNNTFQCYQLNTEMVRMQMDQLNPPNVAGWQAYYLAPGFYEMWLNTATVQAKNKLCKQFIKGGVPSEFDGSIKVPAINKLLFFTTVTGGQAQDVNILIDETVKLLFARPITTLQRQRLKDILIPGLPDFEWTTEWVQYLPTAAQANNASTIAMENKLGSFLYEIMSMAEFQLS